MNKLTHKELIRQLDYDHLTGILRWKIQKKGLCIGDIAGHKNKQGYIHIGINYKIYYAHILAYFHYHGYYPKNEIDHDDQIKHHNWISNLKESSRVLQMQNTDTPKNNTSGVKGVTWDKQVNKWRAQIMIKGKNKSIGCYKDFDDAICARLAGEQCLDWTNCDSSSPAFKYVKENIL